MVNKKAQTLVNKKCLRKFDSIVELKHFFVLLDLLLYIIKLILSSIRLKGSFTQEVHPKTKGRIRCIIHPSPFSLWEYRNNNKRNRSIKNKNSHTKDV